MEPLIELPANVEAERLVLGAVLLPAKGREVALEMLWPADFWDSRNKKIFEVLLALRDRSQPVDLLGAHQELERAGELDAAGGVGYLASLGDGMPLVFDVRHYAGRVKDAARRREIIRAAEHLREVATSGAEPAERVLDSGIEQLSEIARAIEADRDDGITYRDAAARLLGELKEGTGVRIYSGLDALDRVVGGFIGGELVLLTASTGVGKTLFACQVRRRACRGGRHGLYCSGEMRAEHLLRREQAGEAGIEPWKLRREDCLTKTDFQTLIETASHECKVCRILDGELDLARIRRVARRMKGQSGLDLVLLDYDELIEAPGDDELEQQRNLVRGAKSLAIELGCVVVLVSQLRKAIGGDDVHHPTLERIYGSGAKTKHSSIVLFVDRPFVRELRGDETQARICVLKARDGRVGQLDAVFNVRTLRFEDAPAQAPDHKMQQAGNSSG